MSNPDFEGREPGEAEARSSVEIKQTAKGEPQVRVKVYADTDEAEFVRIRELAVREYQAVVDSLARGFGAAA